MATDHQPWCWWVVQGSGGCTNSAQGPPALKDGCQARKGAQSHPLVGFLDIYRKDLNFLNVMLLFFLSHTGELSWWPSGLDSMLQSLVGKLRSHMPCSETKKFKKKKERKKEIKKTDHTGQVQQKHVYGWFGLQASSFCPLFLIPYCIFRNHSSITNFSFCKVYKNSIQGCLLVAFLEWRVTLRVSWSKCPLLNYWHTQEVASKP